MAERPRVVGVCRRIGRTKPAPDLIGPKVRPYGISDSLRGDCRLLHAVNLLLNYSQSGYMPISDLIQSRVSASLAREQNKN